MKLTSKKPKYNMKSFGQNVRVDLSDKKIKVPTKHFKEVRMERTSVLIPISFWNSIKIPLYITASILTILLMFTVIGCQIANVDVIIIQMLRIFTATSVGVTLISCILNNKFLHWQTAFWTFNTIIWTLNALTILLVSKGV